MRIAKKLLLLLFLKYIFYATNIYALDPLYSQSEIEQISQAMKYVDKKDWSRALAISKRFKDSSLQQVVKWFYYKDNNNANFNDISKFYVKVHNWPLSDDIRVKIEESITVATPKHSILEWFKKFPPVSLTGHKKYLMALEFTNANPAIISKEVKYIYENSNFTPASEKEFKSKYSSYLTKQDIINRVEHLIWQGKINDAKREMRVLGNDQKNLYYARIALMQNKPDAMQLVSRVSQKYQNNEGLVFDLIKYYEDHDEFDKVVKYFHKVKGKLSHYKYWWALKKRNIRSLLENKHFQLAYQLVSNHQNESITDQVDGEWLSGWIALRYLNKPDAAIKHFEKIVLLSKLPVSIARGHYWIGRAFDFSNNKVAAENAYRQGANYPMTFYGQMSMSKLNMHNQIAIPETKINPTNVHLQQLRDNQIAKAAYILSFGKNYHITHKFVSRAVKNAKSPEEIFLLALEGKKQNRNDFAVQVAKDASYIKVMLPKYNFPIIAIDDNKDVDPAFIHALIRQESLFSYKGRVSSAGAMGLMQIMPSTGMTLAKMIGERLDQRRLLNDPYYNLKLGVVYLNKLHKELNGSYVMIAASYNAGPGNVKKWVNRFGDPRKMNSEDEIIDWIELITFEETRNYVMRIMETMQIYHGILSKNKKFISNIKYDILTADKNKIKVTNEKPS